MGRDDRYDSDDAQPYTDERYTYGGNRREDTSYSEYTGAYDGYTGEYATNYTGYGDGYTDGYSVADRALVPLDESEYLPAELYDEDETGPVVIPGTGVTMGDPMLGVGRRSLTMRVAVFTLMTALLASGLFAVTPVGSSANGAGADDGLAYSFQALAGAVVMHSDVSYHWYTVEEGDTIQSIAQKSHCLAGGIYKLNNLYADQDVPVGKAIKIPDDPRYGAGYVPPRLDLGTTAHTGLATLGSDWYNSYAGDPPPEAPCGIDGHGVPTAYQLQPPEWGGNWVRGYSWYHNGDDISDPLGTPIHAAQAGEVLFAGWTNTGFGFAVKINHCFHISTLYGHMEQLNVHAGQYVQPGDIIGFEGQTGWATGPHVHFSVFVDNVFVDPLPYFGNSTYNVTHCTNPAYCTPPSS